MEFPSHSIRNMTFGGMLLGIAPVITSGEILKTACLAAIGGSVSLGMSYLFKYLLERKKK